MMLLRRVADEYGETAAANKARKRLAMFESAGDETALGLDRPEDPHAPQIDSPKTPVKVAVQKVDATKQEATDSNLPPGFRKKK